MRRLVPALLLASAVAASPLAAATEFVAMGDSITAGSSFPASCSICPVVFDCSDGCDAESSSDRENCAHARRLDDWMDGWMGAGNHVVNHGIGGEGTNAAVGRLPNVLNAECGTPGDCNAVILMHGTNDMGDISPESVRDNLALMIAEARSRNIDTLLMTIIRKGEDPDNSTWETYKDLVLALAASEGLQSVDPWQSLCPNQSCYDVNYWLQNSPPCNDPDGNPDPGHLDPDGYDVLTDLIKAVFPAAAPAAPAPTAPAGDVADSQPDFVWPAVAEARWYELDVDGATTWWEAAAHCAMGTCSVDPGVVLSEAGHSWRVRGRNLRGMGAWSAATAFTVWPLPGTPVGMAPSGSFDDLDPANPPSSWEPYIWSEAAGATDYDLEVSDTGGPVLQQSFDASVCVAFTCSVTPGVGLPEDSYTWTVQARNPAAGGTPSAPLAFDVNQLLPPPAPAATAPTGTLFETAPVYEWLEAPGATEYDLEVKDAGGNVDAQATNLPASTVCGGGVCSYQEGTVLTNPDDYTLRVLGRNAAGAGPLSSPGADFTIIACNNPSPEELANLEPSPVTAAEVVTYCGPVTAGGAAAYVIEAAGDLTVHTRDGFAADDGFTVRGRLTVRTP